MNIHKLVNTICFILGAAVVVFGLLVFAGLFQSIVPSKGLAPIVLGGIIILWSLVSFRRHR